MKALIISFVTHVGVIGAVLVGAVLAPERMPQLLKRISPPIIAGIVVPRDVPLSPERPPRTSAKSLPATAASPAVTYMSATPVVAPSGIAPETGREGFPASGVVVGVTDGITGVSDLGTIVAPPPPPPVPTKPVPLHSGMTTPRKVVDVPPAYPEMALRIRVEGMVIIEATIDERGNVIDARILRSVNLLDAAALAAVRQWKFTPARLNGEPLPVVMTVTVNFILR